MGLFKSFSIALHGDKKVLDAVKDDYDEFSNYRETALENTSSHNGLYVCPKCGKKFRAKQMDADHIVPQSKYGSNNRENMQMLCAHCNRSKQDDTSETEKDLRRRQKELKQQDKDDLKFIRNVRKGKY